MDPCATLVAAFDAFNACDNDTAIARLFDYYQWRVGGGFEPSGNNHPRGGDHTAALYVSDVLASLERARNSSVQPPITGERSHE